MHISCRLPMYLRFLNNCPFFLFQEEIKIINVNVFANPYTEPDEDEEKTDQEKEKADDDEVMLFRLFHVTI